MAFDTMGNLHSLPVTNSILKVDSSGNVTTFASGGLIGFPSGLAFDSSGILYVSDGVNSIFKSTAVATRACLRRLEILRRRTFRFGIRQQRQPLCGGVNNGVIVKVDSNGNQSVSQRWALRWWRRI